VTAIERALRLVVILDTDAAAGRDLAGLAAAAVGGGATMLQLRAKRVDGRTAAGLAARILAAAGSVPFVVNDRLDVALAVGAAGCHLGQTDLPIDAARRLAPPGFLLGGSAVTIEEARRAADEGADYLGIGPIAATPSKADAAPPIGWDGFARIHAAVPHLPAVGIGGIDMALAAGARAAGAAGIAVIAAVLGAADPVAATRALRAAVEP
jgi:thiamine-phosphate pyrophosphorylase